MFTSFCTAQKVDSEFKKNNPDGNKYEFARSYISALSYFYAINQRWEKNSPKSMPPKIDVITLLMPRPKSATSPD